MLQGMDQSAFGQFVAALWEREGWQTRLKRDDGRVFVAVQRPETDEEGLLWAHAGEGELGGKEVQQFAELCEEYEVEEGAVVTAGSLTDHAEKVAAGSGVELLDGEGVADVLRRKGWTDLAEQYAGGASGTVDGGDGSGVAGGDENAVKGGDGSGVENDTAGGSAGDAPAGGSEADGSSSDRLGAMVPDALGDATVPTKPALALVVVVAVVAAGVLVGPSVPFLGGDGGPVSAESASPDDGATTLRVAWNATVLDSIDPNESDDAAFYPPEGHQFVVVRMSVNNTGNRTVPLKQSAFELRTDERTYDHQSLRGYDGFVDFNISPGTRYPGWTVFAVPEGTTGTLVYDQNATSAPVAVEFRRDPGLPVNVTRL